MAYEDFRVTGIVAPSERGAAKVSVTTPAVTHEHAAFLAMRREGHVRVGEQYTLLHINGSLVMSDTRDEYMDHFEAIREARGRVLIHGLGLGCFLRAILAKPDVEHVDVVERDPDVIDLISPHYTTDPRVNLVCADAFTLRWPPRTRWDCVWHDVWPNKCTDDLGEHAQLLRSYGRRADWQGAWAREELVAQKRRDRDAWWA